MKGMLSFFTVEIDVEEFLDQLGQELVEICCDGRLERAFRSLGDNMVDFITTLNSVHDVLLHDNEGDLNGADGEDGDEILDSDQPGYMSTMTLPESHALELNFTCNSPSVAYLLVGVLKGIADRLYDTVIRIDTLTQDSVHFRYIITSQTVDMGERPTLASTMPEDLTIGVSTFCKAFPWHFILDRELNIIQIGNGFTRMFGSGVKTIGVTYSRFLKIKKPRGGFHRFEDIIKRANTPFLLTLLSGSAKGLEVKGQMVYLAESGSIFFIGSPFLDGLDGLNGKGLFISDIPIHDATRDVILVGEQARAQTIKEEETNSLHKQERSLRLKSPYE
ncbi:hypothetical protein RUM44_007613 [Polyplax serrata]|uniref:guanylate cyclase n=1 Tax=Polyplax serrata TaxID=468196 RepID=A0ABR1BA17_POLSC